MSELEFMEDVGDATCDIMDMIESELLDYGVELGDAESDEIYEIIFAALESQCKGDYRNHN